MGSLSASGIPVVSKTSDTIRKFHIRIKKTTSTDDSTSTLSSNRPELSRAIGSGSVVRDSGNVDYLEEISAGVLFGSRTTLQRVASDVGATRNQQVDLGDNLTDAVIPTGLAGTAASVWANMRGERLAINESVADTQSRIKSTGVFG